MSSNRDKIISLSDRDHVLLRPGMYIGGTKQIASAGFFLSEGKLVYTTRAYIPGLIKIIFEPIDNSLDVAIKSNFKYANKIDVVVEDSKVSVTDNGYGISQEIDEATKLPSPILAVGTAKAGSNFDESIDREHVGTYGYGVFLTNAFSKEFKCVTCDGKSKFEVVFKDNNSSYEYSITEKRGKPGTTIEFIPDLARFEADGMPVENIDQTHKDIVLQRLYILAVSYPEITFTFNGKKVQVKSHENFASMFGDVYELVSFENGFIAYYPTTSDEFTHYTIINGQVVTKGGTHVSFLNNKIVTYLRDKLAKKYKDIKPSDIRNKLMLVTIMRKFPNASYTGQVKEELTNSASELSKYFASVDFEAYGKRVFKNQTIYELISEMYRIKEEFQKQRDAQRIGKKPGKIKSDKYREPVGNKDYLFIVEGDSALGSIMKELGRHHKGYFAVRGKMLNVLEEKMSKISENIEIDSIIKILETEPQQYVLNTSGSYYRMDDIINSTSYIVHEDDLFKVGDARWISISRLDREKYPLTKINRSEFDAMNYYCQPRVNQPFNCSYKNVVPATDQDFDGCFTGDTKIKSPDGKTYTFEELVKRNAKELLVYAKDEHGQVVQAIGYGPRITKRVTTLVELVFNNEYSIKCTADHPILLESGKYVPAIDLTIYDEISTINFADGRRVADNSPSKIVRKKIIHSEEPIPVYDMEVLDYHNFLVETSEDHNHGIIVHNSHIKALMLTLFICLMLPIIKAGRVKYLNTPIVARKVNGKIVDYFFSLDDYYKFVEENPNAKGEWKYYKGLGSWADGELKSIIEKEGIDKFLTTFEYDEKAYETLYNWMSTKTSEYRKSMVKMVQGNVNEA